MPPTLPRGADEFLTGQAANFVNRPTKSRNAALRSAGKDFIVTSPKIL